MGVLRLALVNMPFGSWHLPSLALGQLAAVVRHEFGDEVAVDVHYLNHDFAEHLGVDTYEAIAEGADHLNTGVGEWLFRQVAFPDAPDNADAYFRRYYREDRWRDFRDRLLDVRVGLRDYCAGLVERYGLADVDVLGCTSIFAQQVPSIALARLVKERRPDVLAVFGGANCETPMGVVVAANVPPVDYVFAGPALETFPAFVRLVRDGDLAAADAVPGIVSRRNWHDPRYAKALGADRDVNEVVRPDYDSFRRSLAAHPVLTAQSTTAPTLLFETSRGCWWGERSHCTFCGLNGQSMGYRAMSPRLAVEQFRWLFASAPDITSFSCTDNVMPRNYPAEVFPHLAPPPDVSVYYEVKLPLSRRDLRAMRAAGVSAVQPGIEALATSSLKLMAKGTTAFQNVQFLKACRDLAIGPDWNLLVGFPGEGEAVYAKYDRDLPLLHHLPPPHGVFLVRFDRFSPYYSRRAEYGLDLRPMDFYPLTYPFDPEALADLAYYFTDHHLGAYALDAARWYDRLHRRVAAWHAAWAGRRPELRLVHGAGGAMIEDARGEVTRHHPVDPALRWLLRALSSPVRPERLAALPRPPEAGDGAGLDRRLGWLRGQGMLFEEDGKALSLVTGEEDGVGDGRPAPG